MVERRSAPWSKFVGFMDESEHDVLAYMSFPRSIS